MVDITLEDVLSFLDGGACVLKMVLGKENREKLDQYYSLRARYCRAKFDEKYAGDPAKDLGNVPESTKEFWKTCDASIQKLVKEADLKFEAFNVSGTDPLHGFDYTIDAIGSVGEVKHALILLCFSGSWRKRNAVKLVAQLKMLERGNTTPPREHSLVALMLGKDDAADKLYRVIPRETTYTKNGNIKTEGWDLLDTQFGEGISETRKIFDENTGKPYNEIPTDPAPMNCATCPFHNTIIDDVDGKMTCTGYYRPV